MTTLLNTNLLNFNLEISYYEPGQDAPKALKNKLLIKLPKEPGDILQNFINKKRNKYKFKNLTYCNNGIYEHYFNITLKGYNYLPYFEIDNCIATISELFNKYEEEIFLLLYIE